MITSLGIDRIRVLLNPAAGSTPGDRIEEVGHAFAAAGVTAEIETVEPAQLQARIRALAREGVRALAVGGGDGTISSAANALAGTDIVLIPLPLGTLNHFSTRYGLGTVQAVIPALHDGLVASIPAGEVNGRMFVNNASCGFYPHVVRHREKLQPLLTKWPAALVASLFVTLKRPLLQIQLRTGGAQLKRETAAVWVGLGRHSLRLPIPGDAVREGDVLEVVMPRPHSRIRLAWVALRVWLRLKNHRKAVDEQIEIVRVREFTLDSHKPVDVALDGEALRLEPPLEFRYHPRALKVLCMVAPS